MTHSITAIIIAKNEEIMISGCIKTLGWADQVLVIDNGSTDQTAAIAEGLGANVIFFEHSSFARVRNEALNHVKTDWLVYIDADERVVPTLAKEILVNIETATAPVMSLVRKNVCYGQEFKAGGWKNDVVIRVFTRQALKQWQGRVHETPEFNGTLTQLHTPLVHLTHRNTTEGLQKSIAWTSIEAQLLHKAGIPPVNFLTILRKGVMEFIRRAILWKGYQDGLPGVIEALIQGINKMLVYIQVWELQQSPSLEEQYRHHDIELLKLWEKEPVETLSGKNSQTRKGI
jgi:glycosyltransferase involved in cell wall biosynthesis